LRFGAANSRWMGIIRQGRHILVPVIQDIVVCVTCGSDRPMIHSCITTVIPAIMEAKNGVISVRVHYSYSYSSTVDSG